MNSRKTWIAAQNAKALRPLHAALALVDTAPVKLLFMGDSIVEGTGVSSIGDRFVNRVKNEFCAATGAVRGSDGYYPAIYSALGPSWGTTGNAGTTQTNGLGHRSWLSAAGSTNFRHLAAVSCDHLQIFYNKGSGFGGFTISIDATVVATVDTHQAGAGPTSTVWDSVTAGVSITPGLHTIRLDTINAQTVATFQVSIQGIMPFFGNATSGVQLWEGGIAANPSWVPTGAELGQIALINPDVVFLCWGVNDNAFSINAAGTAANFKNAATAIAGACATPTAFVFVAMLGNTGAYIESVWVPYRDAIFDAAVESGNAFIDLYEALGWPGTDAVNITDGIAHPTQQGAQVFADHIRKGVGLASSGTNRTQAPEALDRKT